MARLNAKTAKRLRREAKQETKGKVNTSYVRNPATDAVELAPDCTRYVYKQKKRLVRTSV